MRSKKDLMRKKQVWTDKTNKIPADTLDAWLSELIDEYYIVAEAMRLGCHLKPEVVKKVENVARTIITQNNGLVYNHAIINKIDIDNKDLEKAYELSKIYISVDIIKFKNKHNFDAYHKKQGCIISEYEFKKYKDMANQSDNIHFEHLEGTWPFYNYLEVNDVIFKTSPDKILTPLITSHGVYIVHVRSKKTQRIKSFEQYKPELEKVIYQYEKIVLQHNFYHEILEKAALEIAQDNLSLILSEFDRNNNKYTKGDNDDRFLFSYIFNKKRVFKTIKDYKNSWNNVIIRGSILTTEQLIRSIEDYIKEEYSMEYAQTHGLLKTKKYLSDKQNYLNKMTFLYYKNKIIDNRILISKTEIEDYFKSHNFEDGEFVEFHEYIFDSIIYASIFINSYQSCDLVNSKKSLNEIDGLCSYNCHQKILYNSQKYSCQIIEELFSINNNEILGPIEINKKYYVFVKKSEEGKRMKTLKEMDNKIYKIILIEKRKELLQNALTKAKNIFDIHDIVNISEICIN